MHVCCTVYCCVELAPFETSHSFLYMYMSDMLCGHLISGASLEHLDAYGGIEREKE